MKSYSFLQIVNVILISIILTGCLMTRSQVDEYENKKNMQDQVVHLQKNTADQQIKFSEVNNDLREMNGRVDVVENKIKVSEGERQKAHMLLEEQLAETNKKVLALQEEIEKLTAAINSGNISTGTGSAPSNAPVKGNSIEVADDYFAKKDYQNAILWYEKYREKFPNGKKIPEALLRMGLSFQALKMKEEAKGFYNELIQKFPKSEQAKAARARLAKIK
jgi:TolA-binding protein